MFTQWHEHNLVSSNELNIFPFGNPKSWPISQNKSWNGLFYTFQTHNYGVKMILRWVYLLQAQQDVSPQEVCNFAIELLADIVVSSYAIFARLGERFATLVDHTPRVYTSIEFSLACLQKYNFPI